MMTGQGVTWRPTPTGDLRRSPRLPPRAGQQTAQRRPGSPCPGSAARRRAAGRRGHGLRGLPADQVELCCLRCWRRSSSGTCLTAGHGVLALSRRPVSAAKGCADEVAWRRFLTIFGSGTGPPGSDGGTATVSGDDRAGDVAGLGRGEEGDHAGDLVGLGGPAQQGRGAECLGAGGGGSVGQDRPGSDGIDPEPAGLNSAAQERVIAARVALVAA